MKKAVLYIRVSTQEQVTGGVSMDQQEARLKLYCEMQGLEIAGVIKENGVSGGKPLETRPGGKELSELVNEEAGHIVALKLDRLFRDSIDALTMTRKWDKAGISLHLVDMGGQAINTGSAMGRFFLNTMAGFAELERNLIGERTEAALSHKKENKEVYSTIPYGYTREGNKLKENQEELSVIKIIKELRENNYSLQKIADYLTAKGYKTKKGGNWFPSTVSYILKNKLYEEVA